MARSRGEESAKSNPSLLFLPAGGNRYWLLASKAVLLSQLGLLLQHR